MTSTNNRRSIPVPLFPKQRLEEGLHSSNLCLQGAVQSSGLGWGVGVWVYPRGV